MYRFTKRVRCAYIFFIEIIEIIEISRKLEKKLAFPLVFFEFWSISK